MPSRSWQVMQKDCSWWQLVHTGSFWRAAMGCIASQSFG